MSPKSENILDWNFIALSLARWILLSTILFKFWNGGFGTCKISLLFQNIIRLYTYPHRKQSFWTQYTQHIVKPHIIVNRLPWRHPHMKIWKLDEDMENKLSFTSCPVHLFSRNSTYNIHLGQTFLCVKGTPGISFQLHKYKTYVFMLWGRMSFPVRL